MATAFIAASLVLLGYSGDSGSNVSTATDAAEFDFTGNGTRLPSVTSAAWATQTSHPTGRTVALLAGERLVNLRR
jgi:hypothetical protein